MIEVGDMFIREHVVYTVVRFLEGETGKRFKIMNTQGGVLGSTYTEKAMQNYGYKHVPNERTNWRGVLTNDN